MERVNGSLAEAPSAVDAIMSRRNASGGSRVGGGTGNKDIAMTRILLLAAVAASLIAPVATADAAGRHKHHRHHRPPSGPVYQPYVYEPGQAPVGLRRRGPPWAMPNECFNDEGYGRWSPCGGRDF